MRKFLLLAVGVTALVISGCTSDPTELNSVSSEESLKTSSIYTPVDVARAGLASLSDATLSAPYHGYKDGTLVNVPGFHKVWVIMHGKRRHIPDMNVFNRLFISNPPIISSAEAGMIPEGPVLSADAELISCNGAIYLKEGIVIKWITSPQAMTNYSFDWSKIRAVTSVSGTVMHAPLSHLSNGAVVKNSTGGAVYIVEYGTKRGIEDPTAYQNWVGDWNAIVTDDVINSIPAANPNITSDARIFKNSVDNQYYILDLVKDNYGRNVQMYRHILQPSKFNTPVVALSTAVTYYKNYKVKNREVEKLIESVIPSLNDGDKFNAINGILSEAIDSWYTPDNPVAATVTKPYYIKVQSIKCFTTEDYMESDEARIHYYADGVEVGSDYKVMKDGDIFEPVRDGFKYNNTFSMRLIDEDNPDIGDGDDWLGDINVLNTVGTYTAAFNRDGAYYAVNYSVGFTYSNALSTEQQKAISMNNLFKKYLSKTDFLRTFSKDSLASDINRTIKDPAHEVKQVSVGVCGTVSVIFELARKFPKKFVSSNWEVFSTYKLKGFDGSENTFPVSNYGTAMNKGLLYSDLLLTGAVNNDFSGTGIGKLERIIRTLLPYTNVGTETTYIFGEESAIRRAARIVDNGGVAFLKIDHKMMATELLWYEKMVDWSDHIVVMLGGLSVNTGNLIGWDNGHFTFNYWSWGQDGWMMYAEEGRFEDGFYGLTYAY
jgi:hypothetical protein